ESVGPAGDFVRDEAGQAKARGILVPVLLERGVRPPLGFGELQAIDLSHWRGGASDPFFCDLVAACQAKLEGRGVPSARGPMRRLARRLTIGSVASALTAGLFAFAMNFMSMQDHACTLLVGQPTLGDVCGALGLGSQPTREERVAFEALPPGDCEALSDYRDAYEDSPLRAVVDSRLAGRTPAPEPRWVAQTLRQTLYQPQTASPASTEQAAREAALTAAEGQALRLCRTAEASGLYRLQRATPIAEQWECEPTGGGYVCSFMGQAECAVEQRETVYQCGGAQ
ncbi:MAG: hypothetical protein ACOYMK_18255, partial [Hyphomonadaceae bacterium]